MAVLNQNMAEANQRTALDTATIAEETQRDSASMITLAAVTMVFLPGTFVCTIVSTNFFDFGERELQVSDKWWALLVAGVPLTLIVFAVWYKWKQWRFEKQKKKRRQREITAVRGS
jgi:drug/metabolite transporter (DMT)-like permease